MRCSRSSPVVSAGKRKLGRVLQGLLDGQLLVQDVVLRDQTDALAQLGELLVEVAVVVEDVALVGGPVAGECLEQGRLAGTGRSDDRDQGLLRDTEGDVLEDLLAAVDRDGEVAGGEGDLAGVDELLQAVADDPEGGVADTDDVRGAEQQRAALGNRLAVDVRAVVRAQVADLHAAVGHRVELGVVAGDLEVGDNQVVLQGTADTHDATDGELVERGRAAVAVDGSRAGVHSPAGALLLRDPLGLVRRVRPLGLRPAGLGGLRSLVGGLRRGLLTGLVGRRLVRGLLGGRLLGGLPGPGRVRALRGVPLLLGLGGRGGGTGEAQQRAVVRVAEAERRAGAQLRLVDPLPVQERPVGAAVVLDDPVAPAPADRGVPPGHPGVVEHDVTLRITPKAVRPGRIERPGTSIRFQYEFRHATPH
ncbi:hypothetical protein SGRIM119S_07092 [Streptomyces griseorubiginosus]